MSLLDEAVVLNDGSLMPKVGVTVTSDEDVARAMKAGYRLLNCTADEKIDFKANKLVSLGMGCGGCNGPGE